ncbi:leucine-rich repeat domain-containing protein [Bacteroides sp. OttesenSCG-928-D19]|nr:leucine-rich repeat domain-containing protein [Bacteroides sp. OttesenSCG-928-N06]MDL2305754.1 leucine-rich repeat domain-containing protein [Bacteroides sp. OttesenSCG-928-D19]
MKKVLFYASLLAFAMTGCSEDDFGTLPKQNESAKGIVFEVQNTESVATRSDLEKVDGIHYRYWYAESDKIEIYSLNTNGTYGNSNTTWNPGCKALYKATKSQTSGEFTAIDDANILNFRGDGEANAATFFAVTPVTKVGVAENQTADALGGFKITNLDRLALEAQTQEKATSYNKVSNNLLSLSHTTGFREKNYQSVGERAGVQFYRPLTVFAFKTKNFAGYEEDLGNLKSITVETMGYTDLANQTNNINASKLNYASGSSVVYDETTKFIKRYPADYGSESELNKVALRGTSMVFDNENASNINELILGTGNGLKWSDDNWAYMQFAQVDRSAFRKAGVKEKFVVTYNFTTADVKLYGEASADWPNEATVSETDKTPLYPNNVYERVLDLDEALGDFNYLVTKGNDTGGKRSLIIFNREGSDFEFADIFDADGKVIWPVGTDESIELSKFAIIKSAIEVDMPKINEFVNVEKLKLDLNTEIAKNELAALDKLTSINMAKLTKIEDTSAFNANIHLTEVILPSYMFADAGINNLLLQKGYLRLLDMSAVKYLSGAFPASGFTLNGFNLLEEVTVNDVEGLTLGDGGVFQGCTALTTVEGKVVLGYIDPDAPGNKGGADAFNGCIALTELVVELYVDEADEDIAGIVPAGAFNGCTVLANIVDAEGNAIAPITISDNAFLNCAALAEIDLTKVLTVGANAFEGCAALEGAGTDTENFSLMAATSVGASAFKGCTSLGEVKLKTIVTYGASAFEGCTSLKGVDKYANKFLERKVVWVSAETLPANLFKDCKGLTYVYFEKATTVSAALFNGILEEGKEVKFELPFKMDTGAGVLTFGGTGNTGNTAGTSPFKLYVDPQQGIATGTATYVDNVLTIAPNGATPRTIEFTGTIVKE